MACECRHNGVVTTVALPFPILHSAQYFVLIVPAGMILLGLALLACWRVLRQQDHLLWLAAGFILPSLALGWQSLLDNAQLARWSVAAGALYLTGAWTLAHGLARRAGGHAYPRIALLIGGITLLLQYQHATTEQLWLRALILNSGLALLHLLPLRSLFRIPAGNDTLERTLRISYVVLAAYALSRPLLILTVIPTDRIDKLTQSSYWLAMLALALLFSIWFMLVLLTCTVREVLGRLRDERNRDPLTHLLNRRAFAEAAEIVLRYPNRGPWALLICDIDHFKRVNDTWGHSAGDQVLENVAQVLLAQVRQNDLVARFGGEEFMLLLNGADLEHAQRIAERIQTQLPQTHFTAIQDSITASFGLTPIHSLQDLAQAFERADAALYRAKQDGRNRISIDLADAPA